MAAVMKEAVRVDEENWVGVEGWMITKNNGFF